MTVTLTGTALAIEDLVRIGRDRVEVRLDGRARERVAAGRAVMERSFGSESVYGLNTGVGMRKRNAVSGVAIADFQRLVVAGHLTAQGPVHDHAVVRGMAARLANQYARGENGVRPELVDHLVRRLNEDRMPPVRTLGSAGMSDLAAMADLAIGLTDDIELAAGEALALVNSNASNVAPAAFAAHDLRRFCDSLDVAAALDLEAFAANLSPLHAEAIAARPYRGVAESREHIVAALTGSALWSEGARNLQDPLTFRGVVHQNGALRDAVAFLEDRLFVELNAHQGNPFVSIVEDRAFSVASFEVVALAQALDLARIALATALSTACERTVKLLQAPLTGLPEGLGEVDGQADCGLSEFGWAAMSMTAEARLLAAPVSFEIVSTSQAEQIEDRMTMAPLAVRRLREMIDLGCRVTAIGVVLGSQALDLRAPVSPGAGVASLRERVRAIVPFTRQGEPVSPDLEAVVDLVRAGL